MDDIVIISPDIEPELREKIAEILRIRQIQTTDDMNQATVVILSPNQIPGPGIPLAITTEEIIKQYEHKIFELKQKNFNGIFDVPLPTPKNKKHKKSVHPYVQKYNKFQQRQRAKFLTRTKHK